jgi:hypothetical protein
MSGCGIERDLRGRRIWDGEGSPPPARETREAHKTEAKFKGAIPELPSLNYGASPKDNRPIEFLQLMREHSARTYNDGITKPFGRRLHNLAKKTKNPSCTRPYQIQMRAKSLWQILQTTKRSGKSTKRN